ncbi:Zn-ribbon domain-containing OB-fold protein [Nocardia farcinica]|uniref:ChsH2 C-terminal OB-fold domain-containing protein n=2 Tax=Nocardia farcinica TaxID=37329 RepID=Q5YXH2_NOCFA|nr:OB-fold domain-containing protein [Nocardia farcinica]AXK85176.1 DNA-binding protein [Nocardia farcinica]MBA4858298.1 OB-fold domain-containing protein [Nocardia farcinica]MBC9818067.1 OB-fold domain-containing protein [Nocardia farcinica]MBF6140261.1 OB-fold domain-containing protein [Nocardia farcinica]MBF6359515.1 OB-fold domain-containing protein [Nocardia farcinica]
MDEPVLEGSECGVCGTVGFPASTMCARCATPTARPRPLSRDGVVWAYTVQRFPPKSPPYVAPAEGFSPYAVGWVELPDGIRVEALLDGGADTDLDRAPVRLVAASPVPRFAVIGEEV